VEVWLLPEWRLTAANDRFTPVFAGIAVLKKKAFACRLILQDKR
jgi:hypothetical protein